MKALRLALVLSLATMPAMAAGLDELNNYLEYSERLSSAGQPTAGQLELLRNAGFERIVYLAFSDHENALPNEDRLVESLGMEYLQVPVDWSAPTPADFYLVAGALQAAPERRTLLHCQVNYRASAFSFLYRVIYQGVPVADAKRDMLRVWQPDGTWQRYIDTLLNRHGFGVAGEDGEEMTEGESE